MSVISVDDNNQAYLVDEITYKTSVVKRVTTTHVVDPEAASNVPLSQFMYGEGSGKDGFIDDDARDNLINVLLFVLNHKSKHILEMGLRPKLLTVWDAGGRKSSTDIFARVSFPIVYESNRSNYSVLLVVERMGGYHIARGNPYVAVHVLVSFVTDTDTNSTYNYSHDSIAAAVPDDICDLYAYTDTDTGAGAGAEAQSREQPEPMETTYRVDVSWVDPYIERAERDGLADVHDLSGVINDQKTVGDFADYLIRLFEYNIEWAKNTAEPLEASARVKRSYLV